MTTLKLLQFINSKGHSRAEVKSKCGIKASTYSDWELQHKEMKFSTAMSICQTLKINLKEFLSTTNIR